MDKSERIAIVSQKLIELFGLIGKLDCRNNFATSGKVNISTSGGSILRVSDTIAVPGIEMPDQFWGYQSPLPDDFLPDNQFSVIVRTIRELGGNMRLNHIGFCYPIGSLDKEHIRLSSEIAKTDWKLYKEGDPEFRFIGDVSRWADPMIEFVPVVNIKDEWVDYWLPHIQIDFDTNLLEDEINHLTTTVSGGRIRPYKLVIVNGQTLVVRLWLGTLCGMNFYLDLGTEGRMTRFYRTRVLKVVELPFR